MERKKKRFRLLEFFLFLVPLLLVVWYAGWIAHDVPDLSTAAYGRRLLRLPFLSALLFVLLFLWRREWPPRFLRGCLSGPEHRRLLALFLLFALPRLFWRLLFPSALQSDYGMYVEKARLFAAAGSFAGDRYLISIAPSAAGYIAVLGLLMRLFGPDAAVARWFCMLLNCGNVFLLYACASRLTSRSRAFLAAALFALLPENVFYSVLPGVEALSLFTILLGLRLILGLTRQPPVRRVLLSLGGGLLLGLSGFIRASAWAAAAAAVVWMLLSLRLPFRRLFALLAAFVLGIAGSWLCHRVFQNRVFPEDQPAGGIGWSLYEGLDLNGGIWTPEKNAFMTETMDHHTAAECDRIFREEAVTRFRGYTFTEKLRMFARKVGIVWFDPGYPVFLLDDQTEVPDAASDVRQSGFLLLALWMACMAARVIRPLRGRDRAACALCLVFILLSCLWHEFGTSIGRYRYMMMPFVILMTALSFPAEGWFRQKRRKMESEERWNEDEADP